MKLTIVVLEDNAERRKEMKSWLSERLHQYRVRFFRDPRKLNFWLQHHHDKVLVASLDHDLTELPANQLPKNSSKGRKKDLTGRDVAEFLVLLPPTFPVLIHSSNAPAANSMATLLLERGWLVELVTPFEDLLWIGAMWYPALRKLLIDSSRARLPRESASSDDIPVMEQWLASLRCVTDHEVAIDVKLMHLSSMVVAASGMNAQRWSQLVAVAQSHFHEHPHQGTSTKQFFSTLRRLLKSL